MRCPDCKTNDARPWEGRIEVMGVGIQAYGMRCPGCGETLFAESEIKRQEREVAGLLVARGIRSGSEFKFVRKVAGFRANEVAEMFGVRPETVSRWERGEVEMPLIYAYALGELYAHPQDTRQKLEAVAR